MDKYLSKEIINIFTGIGIGTVFGFWLPMVAIIISKLYKKIRRKI